MNSLGRSARRKSPLSQAVQAARDDEESVEVLQATASFQHSHLRCAGQLDDGLKPAVCRLPQAGQPRSALVVATAADRSRAKDSTKRIEPTRLA